MIGCMKVCVRLTGNVIGPIGVISSMADGQFCTRFRKRQVKNRGDRNNLLPGTVASREQNGALHQTMI